MSLRYVSTLALTMVLATSGTVVASEFNERFGGEWDGSGQVLRAGASSPQNVSCSLAGDGHGAGIELSGECRAMLIFSRQIGVDVSHDGSTGQYTGIYIGSSDGPAQLSGQRNGDALHLDVRFASEIYDGHGTMVVRSTGPDRFELTMRGGADEPIADLVFERRS